MKNKNNFQFFIKGTSDGSRSLVGALFKRSDWLLKARNVKLDGKVPAASSLVPGALIESAQEKPTVTPTVDESVAPPRNLSENTGIDLSAGLKLDSEAENIAVKDIASKYEVADLNNILSSLQKEWKIEDTSGIASFNGSTKVLFYGLDEISPEEGTDQIPVSLLESEQDLMGKMIKAMGLKQGEFVRFPIFKMEQPLKTLLAAIQFFKPEIIVPLGANATNIVLEKKVKLSNVHGEILQKTFLINGQELLINLSPLFHPQLLEINQSMKRTAWMDMKKVMEFVGNRHT